MSTAVQVVRAGHLSLQDLGRPGHASLGVPVGGACDQRSARTANALTGNADDDALLEVTGSELGLRTDGDLLLAVTGAADVVLVNGIPFPADELLAVSAGSEVVIPRPTAGLRSYVAVNGGFAGTRTLGSVAPDLLLGIGGQIQPGARLVVRGALRTHPAGLQHPFFRLGYSRAPGWLEGVATVMVTPGPDFDRLAAGCGIDGGRFTVTPQSDQVGLRLDGAPLALAEREEILSRGVPVGAVELLPSGRLIVLLRGRLVTAGYPVLAVATTISLDRLGQLRPGDQLELRMTTSAAAVASLRAQHEAHVALCTRVRNAFAARGLDPLIDADHGRSARNQ